MNSILIVVLSALLFSSANSQDFKKCEDNEKCIIFEECTVFMNALGNITDEQRRDFLIYIRSNKTCGSEVNHSKVCCPKKPVLSDNHVECGVPDTLNGMSSNMYHTNDYPWVALLKYRTEKTSGYRCTGVLIHHRYVLTAASCLDPEEPIMVYFNKDSVFDDAKDVKAIPVKRVIKHENFTSFRDNFASNSYDIGLIELYGSVSINPICLPKKEIQPVLQYVAAAYGIDLCIDKVGDKSKRILTLKPIDEKTCRRVGGYDDSICAIKTYPNVTFNHIETGGALSDYRTRVVILKGIRSPPIACTNKFAESYIYTDVRQYLEWIEKNAV